jgi:hypothetical protein
MSVMTRTRAIDRLRQASTRRARELPIETYHDSPSPAPLYTEDGCLLLIAYA